MKIVIPGGTGQVGAVLRRSLTAAGHDVTVLTRRPVRDYERHWDGETIGPWAEAIDGSDAVVNLAGRSVSCRYNTANLRAMLASRVRSTRLVGEAIATAARPPRVWLQMSTATVYSHRFDGAHDEATGIIGGNEPDVPDYWAFSVHIAQAWERAQERAATPETRKVALRAAMVMSPDRGGVFDVLSRLARLGLGGPVERNTSPGFTTGTSPAPSPSSSSVRISRARSTSPPRTRCRTAMSCASCAGPGGCRWGCPRRSGWPSWGPS